MPAMEGIAMNLKLSLDELERHAELEKGIQFCGGGARNPYWMQMFADVFKGLLLRCFDAYVFTLSEKWDNIEINSINYTSD